MAEGVSIVIATRDRPALLEQCLARISRHARPQDEILVVDSASKRHPVRRVAEKYPAVRVIRADRGTSRARNAGWRAASRDVVAFIDDDCLVEGEWPGAVQGALSDPSVGFATGRVLGDRQAAVGISLLLDADPKRFDRPVDPGLYGHGSNMAFRRAALEAVGGFDESLGPGTTFRAAEDQDIFWRLARAGWVALYEPRATVTHLQWRSRSRAISRHFAYGIGVGAVAVKIIRSGDPLGWPVLRRHLWRDGLAQAGRLLAHGHESPAAAILVKVAGVMVGALRARLVTRAGDGTGRGAEV